MGPGIPLSVTTRGIGFAIVNFFNLVKMYGLKLPVTADEAIFPMYRLCLAAVERKLCNYGYSCNGVYTEYITQWYRYPMQRLWLPESIKVIIDAIGAITHHGVTYNAVMTKDVYDEQNIFIPRPENINLTNLRKTVVSLSSEMTPLQYRKDFFSHNSIPGASWDEDTYILTNPNEIITEDYDSDLENNLFNDTNKISLLANEQRHFFPVHFERVDCENKNGNLSMFMSNKMSALNISNKIKGALVISNNDLHPYFSQVKLSKYDELLGAVALLGEVPENKPVLYKIMPLYSLRREVTCPYYNLNSFMSCQSKLFDLLSQNIAERHRFGNS